jgi:DNA replication protein DnaC
MNTESAALETATIRQQCRVLHLPAIAAQCTQLAEEAVRERRTHLGYLEALLQAELEEREQRLIERRIREARLPRMKTLEEFDFMRNGKVSAQQIHELARGDYIGRAEPVIFIGDSGTGKTHLLTGLAVAACRQKRRVRFASAAGLVNELVEAKHQLQLGRALSRWARYDLIALDEVGYVPLAEVGAEFLFQGRRGEGREGGRERHHQSFRVFAPRFFQGALEAVGLVAANSFGVRLPRLECGRSRS